MMKIQNFTFIYNIIIIKTSAKVGKLVNNTQTHSFTCLAIFKLSLLPSVPWVNFIKAPSTRHFSLTSRTIR